MSHYGDTEYAPYGTRDKTHIAELASRGVMHSINAGADQVIIACNTASTQIKAVRERIKAEKPDQPEQLEKVVSIIDKSAEAIAEKIVEKFSSEDEQLLSAGILATKATTNSRAYPRAILKELKKKLPGATVVLHSDKVKNCDDLDYSYTTSTYSVSLPDGKKKTIYLNQYSPHKWVGIIERAESPDMQVKKDIKTYVTLFPEDKYPKCDSVGLFCTHYPAVQNNIDLAFREHGWQPTLITQGDLMRQVFEKFLDEKCRPLLDGNKVYDDTEILPIYRGGTPPISEVVYHITGPNHDATTRTIQTLFASKPGGQGKTGITIEDFQYPEKVSFPVNAEAERHEALREEVVGKDSPAVGK